MLFFIYKHLGRKNTTINKTIIKIMIQILSSSNIGNAEMESTIWIIIIPGSGAYSIFHLLKKIRELNCKILVSVHGETYS